MKKPLFLLSSTMLLVSLLLSGCLATIYDKLDSFNLVRLESNTYRVSSSYGFPTAEEAYDMLLLKAAQITLKRGNLYFVIKSENVSPSSSVTASMPMYYNGFYRRGGYFWGAPFGVEHTTIQQNISAVVQVLQNDADVENYKTSKEFSVADAKMVAMDLKKKYRL